MNVCLISDRPNHPVLTPVLSTIASRHATRVVDPEGAVSVGSLVRAELREPADLYLLRGHGRRSVGLATALERAGAPVVNGSAATWACGDRAAMARRVLAAGLPAPEWWGPLELGRLLMAAPTGARYPLVVKSRRSRRRDLVRRVDSEDELRDLAATHLREVVVLQRFLPGDGEDRKLYVVDGVVLGVRQASALSGGPPRPRTAVAVPPAWRRLALDVGRAFDLRIYGVDLLLAAAGPMVVDVNPFPGFRGVPGAVEELVAAVLGRLGESGPCRARAGLA